MKRRTPFLKNKYQAENITLTISIDPSVRGGFILNANNDEYDWSTRSRQQQLQEQIQAARDKAIQMKLAMSKQLEMVSQPFRD